MAYKNIDVSELGRKQRITYKASKVAFFVPRLLSSLAKKVVGNPVTRVVTGTDYDSIKAAAVDLTMQMQKEQADELQEKIDTGRTNITDWENDSEYYIGNIGKFKSYQSTINDLEKKQLKLRQAPKRLLVARNYLAIMKQMRVVRKEEKQQEKLVKQAVEEYLMKKQALESKKLEMEALASAFQKAQAELGELQADVTGFETEHADIVAVLDAESVDVNVNEPEESVLDASSGMRLN